MIRKAAENDFSAILEMSAEFWKSTQYSEPFDPDHTLVMVKLAFEHDLLAVVDCGGVVGFCAAIKSFTLGSREALIGVELAWWINPEHRKGKNGIALLLFMEELVKEQKIKYWNMISMQSSMPEIVGQMYERMGYVHSETSYTKVFHYGCDNDSGSSNGCGSLRG